MSIFVYKRPSFVPTEPGFINSQSCQRYVERAATNSGAGYVPDELAFNNVLNNNTQPPVALGDFMDYLIYIAKDAENLQFFLWYRDYCARFKALDESAKRLSPEWKGSTENIIEATKGSWPLGDSDASMSPLNSHSSVSDRESITALPSKTDGPDGSEHDYRLFIDQSVHKHQKQMSRSSETNSSTKPTDSDWSGCTSHLSPLTSHTPSIPLPQPDPPQTNPPSLNPTLPPRNNPHNNALLRLLRPTQIKPRSLSPSTNPTRPATHNAPVRF